MQIICIDFDSLILLNEPVQGVTTIAYDPAPGVREAIKSFRENNKVVVLSPSYGTNIIDSIDYWLELHDIEVDSVVYTIPDGAAYIDALTIEIGCDDWPHLIDRVMYEKPWHYNFKYANG